MKKEVKVLTRKLCRINGWGERGPACYECRWLGQSAEKPVASSEIGKARGRSKTQQVFVEYLSNLKFPKKVGGDEGIHD